MAINKQQSIILALLGLSLWFPSHGVAAAPPWTCLPQPKTHTWHCIPFDQSLASPPKPPQHPPQIEQRFTAKLKRPSKKPSSTPKKTLAIPYQTIQPKQLSRTRIGNLLGWTHSKTPYGFCPGYYVEPNLFYYADYPGSLEHSPIKITADQSNLSQQSVSTLFGRVVIDQPNRQVTASKAYIYRDPITHKLTTADLYGQVTLREPGKLAIGDKAHINLQNHGGTLNDVIYRMTASSAPPELQYDVPQTIAPTFKIDSPVGWGIAQQFVRQPSGIIVVHQGTYSTCPPPQHFWQVKAKKLTLNKETGVGVARHARLYIGRIPVLYTPYFSFPLDDRRKSGFLMPHVGHSSRSGFKAGIPYYLNLAPNYDLTLEPTVFTERGVQLKGLFRYLTPNSHGNFHGSFLPDDREFRRFQKDETKTQINKLRAANDSFATLTPQQIIEANPNLRRLNNFNNNRYFVSLEDFRHFGHGWSSHLWLNKASDDYYFDDFDGDHAQITDNQIVNKAELFYSSLHWKFTGRMLGYQTLHPINRTPVSNQYRLLPRLILKGRYPSFYKNLSFNLHTQFDDFYFHRAPGQTREQAPSVGTRTYFEPALSLPTYGVWGYIKPEVKLSLTQYSTDDMNVRFYTSQGRGIPGQQGGNINRTLPIVDLDSGLFFDRQTHFFGHGFTQTLEPRLFYLYVPYENQDDIPVFDTSVEPFSFNQLFWTNRFNGLDRIGDTHQVSLALVSRLLDSDTGDERLKLGIGEIYYFKKRRVNLNNVAGLVTLGSVVPNDASVSPIAAEMTYHFNQVWQIDSNIAWNPSNDTRLQNINPNRKPNNKRLVNANFSLQYQRDNNHIFSIGYYYLRSGDPIANSLEPNSTRPMPTRRQFRSFDSINNLSQARISTIWPLRHNWKGFASYTYNFSHDYAQTYFAGLEYDSCCWAVRLSGGRRFKYLSNENSPVYDNSIYLEFALIGLGNVAFSSPTSLLHDTFPDYIDRFGNVDYYHPG